MTPLPLLALAAALLAPAAPAPATLDGPRAIALTRAIEAEPFGPQAAESRQQLLHWVNDTPDVSVTVCDVLGPIPTQDVPNGELLLLQSIFGNAAFQLERPDRRDDAVAVQMAGIGSLLAVYRRLLLDDPRARIPTYDAWLEEQDAGTLEATLAPLIQARCVDPPEA
jgi:hypothetical protein